MVNMGENTRIVSFSPSSASPASDPPGGDVELLLQAIRASFKDILQPGQTFFLQRGMGRCFCRHAGKR